MTSQKVTGTVFEPQSTVAIRSIRVVLVDHDCSTTLDRLWNILAGEPEISLLGRVGRGSDALVDVLEKRPDVLIYEPAVDSVEGLDLCNILRTFQEDARIIVLVSNVSTQALRQALSLGVHGYVLHSDLDEEIGRAVKDAADGRLTFSKGLVDAVRDLILAESDPAAQSASGSRPLSQRESEILEQMALGLRNHEIGAQLGISRKTVEAHVRQILLKLGARTRTQAAVWAAKNGLLSQP